MLGSKIDKKWWVIYLHVLTTRDLMVQEAGISEESTDFVGDLREGR